MDDRDGLGHVFPFSIPDPQGIGEMQPLIPPFFDD
jgi:hypothetical protein